MKTKLQIEKRVGEIFCNLWLERGCPLSVEVGRTRHGLVDLLLEYDKSDTKVVDGLLDEARNIYISQLP